MARIKMVTRTIERTTCKCMVVDLLNINNGIITLGLEIPGKITDLEEAKKILTKIYTNYTIIKVDGMSYKEVLMGMPEEEFINYAKVLDNETRKVIE